MHERIERAKEMLSRQQKRAKEREMSKLKSRLFTYPETQELVQVAIRDTQKKYDRQYSMCLATALSAPPLNFGKKRVCRTLKLFFDQVESMRNDPTIEEMTNAEALRLGVFIVSEDDKLEIYLNPTFREVKDDGGKS